MKKFFLFATAVTLAAIAPSICHARTNPSYWAYVGSTSNDSNRWYYDTANVTRYPNGMAVVGVRNEVADGGSNYMITQVNCNRWTFRFTEGIFGHDGQITSEDHQPSSWSFISDTTSPIAAIIRAVCQ